MKSVLLLLVAGFFLLLIPGGAWATSCVVHSPANATFYNATNNTFEIRCYPEAVNFSGSAPLKLPNYNISYINGTVVGNYSLVAGGDDNTSARNVTPSVTLPDGSLNVTFFWHNRSGGTTILNRLTRLFSVDTIPSSSVLVRSPTNITYSGTVNVTCNVSEPGTMTYKLDTDANVTLSSTVQSYVTSIVSGIADGAHNLTCTTTDARGLSNSSATTYFTVNSSSPHVRLIHPLSGGDAIFLIDTAGLNLSWSLNFSAGINLSRFNISLPSLFTVSGISGVNTSNLTGTLETNLASNRTFIVNLSVAGNAHIFNSSTEKTWGALIRQVAATTEGDGTIIIQYNGTLNTTQDTITVKVRNATKGPFLINNTCGMGVTETRTANKSTFIMLNASPCNFTYWTPYLTPGNATLTNTTGYGWKCTYPCLITNATANSSRFAQITQYVPDNSTTVTVEKADIVSTAGWPGGVAGTAAGAGLAVIFYGAYRVHRGRRRSKEGK